MKLLCLCDSPTRETGFARVAKNLLKRWHDSGAFERIDVWAIGYEGWPYDPLDLPYTMFPAQRYSEPHWFQPENLSRFLAMVESGGYTHVWIMQDTFHFSGLAKPLKDACKRKKDQDTVLFPRRCADGHGLVRDPSRRQSSGGVLRIRPQ